MALIRTPHTCLAAFLALTGLACGPEKPGNLEGPPPLRTITSADALTVANRNLKNGLVAAAHNGAFLSDSKILGLAGQDASAPCPPEQQCGEPVDPNLEARANEAADAIAAQILNASNVELAEATKVVLRLKPEVACATTSSSADFIPTGDCAGSYGAVAVRLELSSRHEGDIDVRLTVDNTPIASLELYAASLAAEFDLGAAIAAYNKMLTAGGDADQVLAGTFQGRARASLEVSGASQIEVAVSIVSALIIDMTLDGSHFRFEAGVSNPLLSARVDGSTNKLTITSNSGGAKVLVPLGALVGGSESCTVGPNGEQICEPRAQPQGDLEIRIPSSEATIEIADGDAITGDVHLGDAITVRHDGQEIITFDLNPNAGRRLGWSVLLGESDVLVELGSVLSASARFNLASLTSSFDVPAWMQNEIFTLDINGAARPGMKLDLSSSVQVVGPGEPPPPPMPRAIVEMTAGVLRLAGQNANQSVTVVSGQCLYSNDGGAEQAHPLESLEARACE